MNRSIVLFALLLSMSACQLSKKEPYTNRLVSEKSLYLRQHAHNPVDWYPWGEEAMEKARTEGKLLLISIGYASCHWCHVMEEETFSDTAVARFMNQHFVSVKVDREERPDVDDIYMTACQYASNESCGWPLNAFATPDGRPIWAGTYFPKKEWVEIIGYFSDLYRNEPQKVAQYANELTRAVSDLNILRAGEEGPSLSADTLAKLVGRFKASADPLWGGRMGAPKFPMPNSYAFLLSHYRFSPDSVVLDLIHTTLDRISQGGIYDCLGGGFARYSVDSYWKVPHFEKMLYDNGQLISLYSQVYRLSHKEDHARVIRHTLDFVAREMTSPEGGFYSSFDADSEGEEGTFYVWTEEQVRNALADESLASQFSDYYQITKAGNWERGVNVLFAKGSVADYAKSKGLDENKLRQDLDKARQKLFDLRAKRVRPRLDEKIIASWNALMLEAYVEAWWALGDRAYLQAALKNAELLSKKMRDKEGGLFRTYAKGQASIPAFLDDYAFAIHAFITLYEATFDQRWLAEAQTLMKKAEERFWDENQGLYYYAAADHSGLVARRAEINDNVIPASNSAMARNAFRLERFYPGEGYEDRARGMLNRLWQGVSAQEDLTYFSNWSRLYLDFVQAPYEIAIVGPQSGVKRDTMLAEYLPNAVWMGSPGESEIDLLKGKYREGKTQIYVCRNRVCQLPVEYTADALRQIVNGK